MSFTSDSAPSGKIRVLVVDDSAVMRQAMTAILSSEPDLEVSTAIDPLIAMDKMKRWRPDVIVLDLEMPRMNGIEFLRKIMAEDPLPVIVCSALTTDGSDVALEALEAGAVEIVSKPRLDVREFVEESAVMIGDAIRAAARASQSRLRRPSARPVDSSAVRPAARTIAPAAAGTVIALGASTGGTEALRVLLESLPVETPGVVIVQHMPPVFTSAFAARLNSTCAIEVLEARDGDEVCPGRALVAPGSRHVRLRRRRLGYSVEVFDGPLVSRHRPSVDVLFQSVAEEAGARAAGALLTGMGDDGALGLLAMRRAGALTIAQDEATCVVFGMPAKAIAHGAAMYVLALRDIAPALMDHFGCEPSRADVSG